MNLSSFNNLYLSNQNSPFTKLHSEVLKNLPETESPVEEHVTAEVACLQRIAKVNQTLNASIDLSSLQSMIDWKEYLQKDTIEVAAQQLNKSLAKLKNGEEIWLPAVQGNIAIGIKRTSNKRYQITTINCSYTSHHPSILVNGEQKIQSTLVYRNIAANRLCDLNFLENFLQTVCLEEEEHNWYQLFLPYLGGVLDKSKTTFESPKNFNSAADKLVKTLFGVLRYQLRADEKIYKQIKIAYRQQLLKEAITDFENNPIRSQLKRIQQSIRQQAKSLEKSWKKWSVPQPLATKKLAQELSAFAAKLKSIKHKAIAKEHQQLIEQGPSFIEETKEIDFDTAFAKEFPDFFETSSENKNSFIKNGDPLANRPVKPIPTQEEILQETSLPKIKEWLESKSLLDFPNLSKSLLDFPNLQDTFWEKIEEAQLENWIKALSCCLLSKSGVGHFYCQAIVTKLVYRHPLLKQKMKGYKALFSRTQFAQFAFSKDWTFTHVQIQERVLELLSFFGLEDYDPARDDAASLDKNVAFVIPNSHSIFTSFSKEEPIGFLKQFSEHATTKKVVELLTTEKHSSSVVFALCKSAYESAKFDFEPSPPFPFYKILSRFGFHLLQYAGRSYKNEYNDKKYLSSKYESHKERIFHSQNQNIANYQESPKGFLSFSSYDRIARTIAFINRTPLTYQKYSYLYGKVHESVLPNLIDHFFQGPILLRSLLQEPRLAIELMQMVQTQMKLYQKKEEKWDKEHFRDYLAYTALGSLLKSQIEYAMQKVPHKYAAFLPQLNPLLIPYDQYLQDLLLTVDTYTDKKQILWHLKEICFAKTKENSNELSTHVNALLFEIFRLENFYCNKKLFSFWEENHPFKHEIMHQVFLHVSGIDTQDQKWQVNLQNSSAACGDYTLDLRNRVATYRSQYLCPHLPQAIQDELEQLEELQLNKNQYTTKRINGHCFEISTAKKSYLVDLKGSYPKVFCEIGGIKYELKQNNSGINGPKTLWSAVEAKTPHYLVQNKEGTSLFYLLKKDKNGNILTGYFSDSLQGTKKLTHLAYSPFGSFADLQSIVAWQNSHSLQSVDTLYIAKQLAFHLQNEKWYSSSHRGFFLTDATTWKQRLGVDHVIVLENANHEQKVLLRIGDMAALDHSLDPVVTPNKQTSWGYCAFDVVVDTEVRLRAESAKEQLVLIEQLFLKKRYSQAAYYLNQLNFIKGMDDHSVAILSKLLDAADDHPDAILLKLRFALQLSKNLLFYQHTPWKELYKLITSELYTSYLQQIGSIHLAPLSQEEEKEVLRLIKEKTPQSISKGLFLNGKKNRVSSLPAPLPPLTYAAILLESRQIFDFSNLSKNSSLSAGSLDQIDLTSDDHFAEVYQVARYGNKQQRKMLRTKLLLTDPATQDPFRYSLLKCLLAFPYLFPLLIFPRAVQKGEGVANAAFNGLSYLMRLPAYTFFSLYHLFQSATKQTTNYDFAASSLPKSLQEMLALELPTRPSLILEQCLPLPINLFEKAKEISWEEILKELNKAPKDQLMLLKKLGGKIKKVSKEEALTLFLQGDLETYKQQNPFLTNAEIASIDAKIAHLLAHASPGAAHQRHYDLTSSKECVRAFLVFEYRSGLFLRPGQVESLTNIWKEDYQAEIVTKQGTGSGKSKVQFPLLQHLCQLVHGAINIWPKPLFPTNRDDIQRQVAQNFMQKAEAFSFDREVPRDVETIQGMNRILYRAVKERRQLSTTAEDMQSVELSFIELLYDMTQGTVEASPELFQAFQKMMHLLKGLKHLVDESHIVQNAKKELNFSIGLPVSESGELVLFLAEIFACLISLEGEKILHLKANEQHLVCEEEIKKAGHLLAKKMAAHLQVSLDRFDEFYAYILQEETTAPTWIEERGDRDKFALLRATACHLIENCFKKRAVGTNYGCKNPEILAGYAIPYESNNTPIKGSEYDITWETLLKTFHTYVHHQLDKQQGLELLKLLRKKAETEALSMGISIEATEEYKFLESILPQNGDSLFDIQPNSPTLQALCQNDRFILRYVCYLVAPHIKKYTKKIRSTVQNLRSQFDGMVTMSATPINPHLYAPSPLFQDDPNQSDSKVEHRIRKTCQTKNSIHLIDQQTPQKMLSDLLTLMQKGRIQGKDFRMLIDSGALLKGLSNLSVARKMLKSLGSPIEGILFFNEKEELVVLERNQPYPLPFHRSLLKPEQLCTYCDHKHIYGADTQQTSEAIGLCTLDRQTSYEEMIQGVGRLRKVMEGQKPEFVLSRAFNSVLNHSKTEVVSIDQLIEEAKINSQSEAEERLYRSLKQLMHNEIRQKIIQKLSTASSLSKALSLFKKSQALLIDELDASVWQMYGGASQSIDRQTALLNYKKKCITLVQNLPILTSKEKNHLISILKSYHQKILDCKFTTPIREGTDTAEAHSEVRKEIQKEVLLEKQVQSKHPRKKFLPRNPAAWPTSLNFYQDNWIKVDGVTKSIFHRMLDAAELKIEAVYRLGNKLIQPIKQLAAPEGEDIALLYLIKKIAVTAYFVAIPSLILRAFPLFTIGTVTVLAAGHITAQGFLRLKKYYYGNFFVSFYETDKILAKDGRKAIREASSFFAQGKNEKLLVTSNFMPMKDKSFFLPFGSEQKKAFKLLMVKENGQWVGIIGDQTTDLTAWQQQLPKQEAESQKVKRQVFIYDLELANITLDGLNTTQVEELKNDKSFQKIILRAKLLNGDTKYSADQFALLREWITNKKQATSFINFMKEILVQHPDKYAEFLGSPLEKFLTRIINAA